MIDYTTPTGQIRLLISDVDETNEILTDGQIDGFLTLWGAEPAGPVARATIKRAAADALDAIATSEALVSKVIRTQDGVTTDGAKVADALRKHAALLRTQADTDDDVDGGGSIEVFEFSPYPQPQAFW